MLRLRKRTAAALVAALAVAVCAIYLVDRFMTSRCERRCYGSIDSVPSRRVALLLGTGKYLR